MLHPGSGPMALPVARYQTLATTDVTSMLVVMNMPVPGVETKQPAFVIVNAPTVARAGSVFDGSQVWARAADAAYISMDGGKIRVTPGPLFPVMATTTSDTREGLVEDLTARDPNNYIDANTMVYLGDGSFFF